MYQGWVSAMESPMVPVEQFRKQAAECRRVAEVATDPAERAHWGRLADGWDRCVETAQAEITVIASTHHVRSRASKGVAGRRPH